MPTDISIHAPARGATSSFCVSFPRSPISIHAPARGATCYFYFSSPFSVISIHAPARGATQKQSSKAKSMENFNPRSREGSDSDRPVRYRCTERDFNPRSREGSDINSDCVLSSSLLFQSTLPRGERRGISR